ncbi:unnamed protein product [Paramecium primaurelia]|uniref:Uncharacterized protein n=1 Tax=Paramecium primaurelia TaxID=5886 RepID=A0A8S1KHP9_PARPR|nr:unnamed protein product [Paramecium primaurelia]
MSNLPFGKKVITKGISFKHVNVDNGTKLIFVDTAGTYSPVKIENELSIVNIEATEKFISDLVFDLADYFLCFVNDFTSLDQRYLDRLSRNLQQSTNKIFREIIVIHNLKDIESNEILDGVHKQHKYMQMELYKKLKQLHLIQQINNFRKSMFFGLRLHTLDMKGSKSLGIFTSQILVKGSFYPVNRSFSVLDCLLIQSRQNFLIFFRKNIKIDLKNTDDPLIKVIKTENELLSWYERSNNGIIRFFLACYRYYCINIQF